MADDFGMQGLSGSEVVADILMHLRNRLERDCSLRPSDSYSRGYSAKITFHVECYGLDKEVIDADLSVGSEQDDPDKIGDGEIVIEQDENIASVRDRIENGENQEDNDSMESETEPATEDKPRQKRKYTKKLNLVAAGGAEEFAE